MSDEAKPTELPQWITDHVSLYERDPEKGHNWDSTHVGGPGVLPTLLLVTRGRKSGRISKLPLIYGTSGDAYVVIASKGGSPTHPAWYLNLQANPLCEVQVSHHQFSARARTASGEERDVLWRQLAEIYPPYDDYQVTAGDRLIPVVVLDPV